MKTALEALATIARLVVGLVGAMLAGVILGTIASVFISTLILVGGLFLVILT